MSRKQIVRSVLVLLLGLVGYAAAEASSEGRTAPLFDNLGDHHHPISTRSQEAQRFFNQGLILAYGFNHQEAVRSFREAARVDPECAMCYWGVALALGPNINAPMADEAVPEAYAALQKAMALSPKASEKEQAYIMALAQRYSAKPPADRTSLDMAYANAMRELWKSHPNDLDAATLFAEALMDTTPWDYWTKDGAPKPETKEIIEALEYVMERDPDHPGANHFYIHAVEASPQPERGLAAARRLGGIAPDAGHLVHMPSHIYLRLGMYRDAVLANEQAVAADESYIAQCKAQGFYPMLYYSHNIHFLWYASSMEGNSEESIRAGQKTGDALAHGEIHGMPFFQWMRAVPLFALARFGKWEEILNGSGSPPHSTLYETAMRHHVRGLAFVRRGQPYDAAREAEGLDKIARSEEIQQLEVPDFPGASVIRIANTVLAAELAGLQGDTAKMTSEFERAVRLQDDLPYMEPPYWYYPVRQYYGAALLEAGRPARAEAIYREDLERNPKNGWSLFGLMQSLNAQGKTEEAADVQKQFEEAWKYADVKLTASRL